jgi:hypothetical protein
LLFDFAVAVCARHILFQISEFSFAKHGSRRPISNHRCRLPQIVVSCYCMRASVPFAILLLACFNLFGQNWRPIALGETHHFRSDTAQHFPDRSIRVDSVMGNPLDSVYYLTRYLELLSLDTAAVNQPGFCQHSMHIRPGGWYQFVGPGNVAIHATAGLNDVWLLDSIQTLSATVEDIWQGTVLGQVDSLKLIRIAGGDSLILSKDHGIVEWPAALGAGHFQLVGLQEQQLGERYPTFEEWFPYQVGQQFFWESEYLIFDGTSNAFYGHYKMLVDSVVHDADGIIVTFSYVYEYGAQTNNGPIYWSFIYTGSSYTVSMRKTGNTAFRHLHKEAWSQPDSILVYLPTDLMDFRWVDLAPQYSTEFSKALEFSTILRTEISRADTALILNIGETNSAQAGCFAMDSSGYALFYMWDQCEYRVRSGLGLEHIRFQGIDENGESNLVGYITLSGDTVGNAWRTWFLTNVGDAGELPVQLYPNPATDRTIVQWPSGDAWKLELMDAKGMLLRMEEGIGSAHSLNVEGLPAGIYLLRLEQGGVSGSRRLSIVR